MEDGYANADESHLLEIQQSADASPGIFKK